MEVADPPKRARVGGGNAFSGPGMFGMPGGRGSGPGMPAGSSGAAGLAAQLMQRMQQAREQPQGGPAQVRPGSFIVAC